MMNQAARIRITRNRDYHQLNADKYKELAEQEEGDASSDNKKLQAMHQSVSDQLSAVLNEDKPIAIVNERASQPPRPNDTAQVRRSMIGTGRIH